MQNASAEPKNTSDNGKEKAIISVSPGTSIVPASSNPQDSSALWMAMKEKHDETKLKIAETEAYNQRMSMGIELAKGFGGQVINYFAETKKAEIASKREEHQEEMRDKQAQRETEYKIHSDKLDFEKLKFGKKSDLEEKKLQQHSSIEEKKLLLEMEKLALEKEKFAAKKEEKFHGKGGMFDASAKKAAQQEGNEKKLIAKATSFATGIIEIIKLTEQHSDLSEESIKQLTLNIKGYLIKNSDAIQTIIGQEERSSFIAGVAKEIMGSVKELIEDFENNDFILDEAIVVGKSQSKFSQSLG
jgi:hypothetical protein